MVRDQKTMPRLAGMKNCCGRKTCLSNQAWSQCQVNASSADAATMTAACPSLRNMAST